MSVEWLIGPYLLPVADPSAAIGSSEPLLGAVGRRGHQSAGKAACRALCTVPGVRSSAIAPHVAGRHTPASDPHPYERTSRQPAAPRTRFCLLSARRIKCVVDDIPMRHSNIGFLLL